MKILSIHIKGYKQFKDTYIDLTDPNGNPVDKVCFIGSNGTGKSTLLDFINQFLLKLSSSSFIESFDFNFAIKIQIDKERFYFFNKFYKKGRSAQVGYDFLREEVGEAKGWFENASIVDFNEYKKLAAKFEYNFKVGSDTWSKMLFKDNASDLVVYSNPELYYREFLGEKDVPKSDVNTALSLFNEYPYYHIVSGATLENFWTNLIFLMKKRDEEREKFENKEENINKTKRQLIDEFDSFSPKILNNISVLWNKILQLPGLEFNAEKANNPIQLNDNLYAYIQLKETKEVIPYTQLSTGIRNFIFRIGHIYSLYFNREIKKGIVLMDEPENSLFPDFLYDLITTYQEVFIDKNGENNTQFFVSTHSPIIAAQFEPYERIILEWDKEGGVKAYKGNAPIGDDPNDILEKDFGIRNIMGKKGQEMWEEFLQLKEKLRRSTDEKEKDKLVDRITELGTAYNF